MPPAAKSPAVRHHGSAPFAAMASAALADLPDLAAKAMQRGDHASALEGFSRLASVLGAKTPAAVYGLMANCLHRLGRYLEAEAMVARGLGETASLLAIPATHTEAEHLERWPKDSEPVISIVCTTFNHERYIEQALRGFLSQNTSYPFEILVHDDASTDRTPDIIREWQAMYPTIIRPVLQTENQYRKGVRPFELLLKRTRGRYVAACEGDDFWVDADKLQRQVDFLEEHPDFSCTAHNYLHFHEGALTVRPWFATRDDLELSEREVMGIKRLLWFHTLVFRKLFDSMPPERELCFSGDFMLTSYLGTFGKCMYFDGMLSSVRRQNDFSCWTPLSDSEKEVKRVKNWLGIVEMHARLGNPVAIVDLLEKVAASPLEASRKAEMLEGVLARHPDLLGGA